MFIQTFLSYLTQIAERVDASLIENMVHELVLLRKRGGRLFLIGVGGSAANASHAVNDFRKLCGIETYAPTDNVSELTARTNDEGWESVFSSWLQISKANKKDLLFVLSVGGGSIENNVSLNIVRGVEEAKKREMRVLGIVGKEEGYTKKTGDLVLVIPAVHPRLVTPFAESFQSIVLHAIVSHPRLQIQATKWEEIAEEALL